MGFDHGALSPRSLSVSTTSPAYAASLPARVLSPHLQKSLAALQNGPPDLRVAVPHPHDAAGSWGAAAAHHMSAQASYHAGAGSQAAAAQNHHHQHHQQRAASWDMSTYLESSSAATAGGSSTSQAPQPMHGQYGPPGRRMSAQQVSQPMPRS
jgi:hypothetical protein